MCDLIEILIAVSSVRVRESRRKAQVDRIAHSHGILSPQSRSQHLGLDYDQEQKNIAQHRLPPGGQK